jgi:biotin carboxyl carrier protein
MNEAANDHSPTGETLCVAERIIVAPAFGIFHRLQGDGHGETGARINQGDVIGTVQSRGASTCVRSPFVGLLMEILALDGERLRPGQPVAWLRVG